MFYFHLCSHLIAIEVIKKYRGEKDSAAYRKAVLLSRHWDLQIYTHIHELCVFAKLHHMNHIILGLAY